MERITDNTKRLEQRQDPNTVAELWNKCYDYEDLESLYGVDLYKLFTAKTIFIKAYKKGIIETTLFTMNFVNKTITVICGRHTYSGIYLCDCGKNWAFTRAELE